MNYMLMIVEPRGQRAERTDAEGRAAYAGMLDYANRLQQRGVLRGVESLLGDDRGARVQVRNDHVRTIDGPFAEAKEFIGGFFLVDCASLADAVALAAECPAAQFATIEVRATGPCFA